VRILALTHGDNVGPGVFQDAVRAAGHELVERNVARDGVPDDAGDAAIVLGGAMHPDQEDRHPWLAPELRFLERELERGTPLLGVCLGAQLIASALGARVYPGPVKEIGWAPVSLSPAGLAGPLRALDGVPVLHWHGDTFDLPDGATLLASTAHTPHQAFEAGGHVLGLQFHPEVDPRHVEAWLIGHTGELAQAGIDLATLRADTARFGAAAASAGRALMSAWLDRIFPTGR